MGFFRGGLALCCVLAWVWQSFRLKVCGVTQYSLALQRMLAEVSQTAAAAAASTLGLTQA